MRSRIAASFSSRARSSGVSTSSSSSSPTSIPAAGAAGPGQGGGVGRALPTSLCTGRLSAKASCAGQLARGLTARLLLWPGVQRVCGASRGRPRQRPVWQQEGGQAARFTRQGWLGRQESCSHLLPRRAPPPRVQHHTPPSGAWEPGRRTEHKQLDQARTRVGRKEHRAGAQRSRSAALSRAGVGARRGVAALGRAGRLAGGVRAAGRSV